MAIQVLKRPYSQAFSGNPIHYELYSALAAADPSVTFEIKVRFKPVGGAYIDVITLPYSPTNGTAAIDIKDIIHSHLEYGVPTFGVSEKEIFEAIKQSGYFYLQFREITTAVSSPSWDDSESDYECFVMKGGLNYFVWRGNNYFVNYHPANKPFLSWQKSGRMAASDERMYLGFLNDTDATALRATIKIFYTDGTNSVEQYNGFPSATKGVIYYVPVGATEWELATVDPAKNINYWQVYIQDITDPDNPVIVSELFKYFLDNKKDYNNTVLHYRNSLGCLDSVRIRGVIEETLAYDYTEQETTIQPDYFNSEKIQGQRRITDALEQLTYKGDIGLLDKGEQDRLRDAFIGRDVLWCREKKWWPVIISTKQNKFRTSIDNRWTMPIEWQLAYGGGEYYTPDSVQLGDGVFTANVCLAKISPVKAIVDTTNDGANDGNALIRLVMTEIDPQDAAGFFKYRVMDGATEVVGWIQVAMGADVEFTLPNGPVYVIEIQAICTNNILGAKTTAQADTSGIGGGGGENSYIENHNSYPTDFEINIDGPILIGNVGAYNQTEFIVADGLKSTITIDVKDFLPSWANIVSNGITYTPDSIVGHIITFTNVDAVGGIIINIY